MIQKTWTPGRVRKISVGLVGPKGGRVVGNFNSDKQKITKRDNSDEKRWIKEQYSNKNQNLGDVNKKFNGYKKFGKVNSSNNNKY